jgi:6-pyruvoyltetrahydropterin/6-carboxytetrahydropterin synthase
MAAFIFLQQCAPFQSNLLSIRRVVGQIFSGGNHIGIVLVVECNMMYVTRKAHFNAAHRLHNASKDDAWNRRTFGPCNNPNWHGHNYVIEVTVRGEIDPETGYVIDLGLLKKIMEEEVLEPCDHKNLNLDVPFLTGVIPSAENLARIFFDRIKERVAKTAFKGELFSVKLFETERNVAEFRLNPA